MKDGALSEVNPDKENSCKLVEGNVLHGFQHWKSVCSMSMSETIIV